MSFPFDSAISGSIHRDSESGELDVTAVQIDSADLYEDCAMSAFGYALSIVRRRCEAEEIVQEAFCRLLSHGHKQKHALDNGKAILFRIVRNLSIDRVRENKRRIHTAIDTHQLIDGGQNNGQQLANLESAVEEIMAEMQREWAESLHLKVRSGLSYEEIAKVLGATHSQVRSWIFRARKRLREELHQRGLIPETDHE